MKYIEYYSKDWVYSKLWFQHSVFEKDWYILSYEMSEPLWKGKFYIYTRDEWIDFVWEIKYEKEVPDRDILQYEWIESEWITCFEALNSVQFVPTLKHRIRHILAWTVILILYWAWMFLFWYYWFSMSEEEAEEHLKEELLQYKEEICSN